MSPPEGHRAVFPTAGELDAHQQAAVDHGDGPALVLAGPGSGKTRVIVERAVRLIDDGSARPEQLLVLTFSRKAATDLRERLAARLRRSYASFPVTTFHAFCFSLLARNAPTAPRLARPAERRRAIEEALAAESHLGFRQTKALAEEALAFCALCDDYLTVPDHELAPVQGWYLEALERKGLTDYGGLQRHTVALLSSDDDLRTAVVETFRHVLVDEYQDTNVAQDTLLELVAGTHRNVFCVADEDQSIYGFRGAELDNTLRFEDRWPGAISYHLPTNYRSAPEVVRLATEVIGRNVDSHQDKPLASSGDRPAELRGRRFPHPAEEADWIAREIAGLRLDGVPLGEIAVLARSLRELGPRLAYALRTHGIPFYAPLPPRLHPTADALLALIELADTWDDELALRTLASPLFGEDALELRRFRREPGRVRDEFPDLSKALGVARRQTSAGNAVYALWSALPYFRELQQRCRGDAAREDVEELAAVTALSDAANEYDGPAAGFTSAYRTGELAGEDWLPAEALPRDAVALLTVHQAKGLEWEAVFICDLVEGRFPALARSQYTLFDRELFARRPLTEQERARRALEEERRIFYVALTRARARLALTATEEAREEAGRSLSRFYLEAQDSLDEAGERDGFVSAAEALAALRRAGGGPPGWRDRAETLNENPMLRTGAFWTSATRLAPYENCPLQFFFGSQIELRRTRTAAMTLGGVFHDVVEAFHHPERNEPQTLERLLELAEEKWPDTEIEPRALAVASRRALDTMLENYFSQEVDTGRVGNVLAVECRFEFSLGGISITGYIDRIDRRPGGGLRLTDYKTGKRLDAAEDDLQLALYALACAEVPELNALGEVAELEYLYPRVVQARGLARRTQTVTPDLAIRTRERVVAAGSGIVAEQFDFSPEADCKWCEFLRLCPRHFGRDAPL